MNLSATQLRQLGSVIYYAAVALMINSFAQFAIQVWPLKLSELNWRVGAAGLLMDALLGTVLPLVLFTFAAFMNNDRRLLQVLRWAAIVIGVLTIALLLSFALDSVQIRAQLPQNVKGNFIKVAARASLIGILLGSLFIWTGLTMGKVLKSQGTVRTAGTAGTAGTAPAQEGMLLVGSREPARPALRAVDGADTKTDGRKDNPGAVQLDA